MKKLIGILFILGLIFTVNLKAQEETKSKNETKPEWDVPPAVLKSSPIKYPEDARKDKIEGKVFLKVSIDKEGKVKSTELIKHENLTESMIKEAQKSVSEYVFKPAKLKGKPVEAVVTLPIKFKLMECDETKKK